jgi:hypothetical protein
VQLAPFGGHDQAASRVAAPPAPRRRAMIAPDNRE